MSKGNILVVDDDARLRGLLESYMHEQGFQVHSLADSQGVDDVLARENIDLIILDLGLPSEDGLDLCRRLRSQGTTPILILTARGDEVDRILGLELGADDYMPKPFNPRELVARIHAVLRRIRAKPVATIQPPPLPVHFGDFTLDIGARLLLRGDTHVRLSGGEIDLLILLARHMGQPLSRSQIMLLSRGRSAESYDQAVDVQISRLRRAIEDDASKPRYIQTVWGYGYVFVDTAA
jgi:DNA-binding response OmpR family regulator